MTYNFEIQTNGGVRVLLDNVYKRTYYGASLIEVVDSDTFDILDNVGGRHRYKLTLKTFDSTTPNTFQLNGVTIDGTVEDVCMTLETVFHKATSTGGGGGSTITSLDDVPQGTETKKLTASEYSTLQQIIAAYTTP